MSFYYVHNFSNISKTFRKFRIPKSRKSLIINYPYFPNVSELFYYPYIEGVDITLFSSNRSIYQKYYLVLRSIRLLEFNKPYTCNQTTNSIKYVNIKHEKFPIK